MIRSCEYWNPTTGTCRIDMPGASCGGLVPGGACIALHDEAIGPQQEVRLTAQGGLVPRGTLAEYGVLLSMAATARRKS